MSAVAVIDLNRARCPACGNRLAWSGLDEPALVRHGGYGATRATRTLTCVNCGYEAVREIGEVAP